MLGIEAPYYVVKATPIRVVTVGGIVIDKEARVLDESDQPIEGLYAAGELANGSFFYNVYSACGSAVGHAIVYGRIAARNAAAAATSFARRIRKNSNPAAPVGAAGFCVVL